MTSVERVMTYTELDSEPGYKQVQRPPENWPREVPRRGLVVSFRRCAVKSICGKSREATGSRVVGTWCKCQCRRAAVNLFGSCVASTKQDHHLGFAKNSCV